jgi:Protein of unknown function (DUF4232)
MRTGWIAALLALVLVGCGTAPTAAPPLPTSPTLATSLTTPPTSAPASASAIPWRDQPAPAPYDPKPLPTTPPPADAPPCTADQLSGKNLGYPGITQDDGDVIDLRNVSKRTCLLAGPVHATLYGPGAPPLTITGSDRYSPKQTASFNMTPGQSTRVWFFATGECMSGPAKGIEAIPVTRATIVIPGGGLVTVGHLNMPRTCGGPSVAAFLQQLPAPTYPPTPLQGAKFYLSAPTTVHAGQSFDYVVTLANPSDEVITMTPCPGYDQWISVGTPPKDAFGLNCAGHRSLAPHQRLRFQMRLTVPVDAPSGPATLGWQVQEIYPGARVKLTVVGNDIPCRAGQLTASTPKAAQTFSGTGFYWVKDLGTALLVTVSNRSRDTCTLQGSPTFTIDGTNGRPLPVRWATGDGSGEPMPFPAQIRLPPGATATVTLSWHSRWCLPDPNPVTVSMALPSNGGVLTVRPVIGWTPPPCRGPDFDTLSASHFQP